MARLNSRCVGSFTVNSCDVEKICKLLESQIGPPKISTECLDDVERSFNSFDELASYENPSTRRITSLSISSSVSWQKEASVAIERASVYFHSDEAVLITVEGQERDSVELRDQLNEIVHGTKNWFTFITKTLNSIVTSFLVSFIWMMILLYYVRSTSTPESTQTSWMEVPFPILVLTLATVILVVFAPPIAMPFALERMQKSLFPRTYFALGQGKRRYQTTERIRWGLVFFIPGMAVSGALFLANRAF